MIQSVERALDILELLSLGKNGRELGLVEIATALQLDKSTIYNLIKTLQARGYVEQAARGEKYRPSRKFLTLGNGGMADERLAEIADTTCRELQKEIEERVALVAWRAGEIKIICRILCANEVVVAPNTFKPLYSTVSGRCLLAQLSTVQVDEVIEKNSLPGETWPEADSRENLLTRLQRIKAEGCAVLFCEQRQVGGLGYIIPAAEGLAPLAVGTAMPLYRFKDKQAGLTAIMKKYTTQLTMKIKGML
ncbi:MAG: hypothetical protein A2096_12870 [Spirochaetes bacterium GWF1_41_5]|nr:MAG: hypothetical protein A2096_12870 [Spirochaetes bacterium GWF1_41_5]HBE04759.1 hypothetical protein [Spirochaetia bacterium]